jgi:hypothetical protein
MVILFLILFASPWIYAIGFAIYIVVMLIQKKKLPVSLLLIKTGSIAALLLLHQLVSDHKVRFFGSYVPGGEDWGDGLANLYTSLGNLMIVLVVFFVVQGFLLVFFKRELRKLNKPSDRYPQPHDGKVDIF